MRQTKKDDPHMSSGGIALRHVQDVRQFAIFIPPQWSMPIPERGKKEKRRALRQAPVIVTGDFAQQLYPRPHPRHWLALAKLVDIER
jgi:hypothetical protein